MLDEHSEITKTGKNISPWEAAEGLEEWADKHAEALKAINSVEVVRETRESR
jgi:hypothetical protein